MANENEIFPVDDNDTDICVTLELDNGESLECEILTIFDAGDLSYIALVPVDKNGNPDEEYGVLIYRYDEDETGEPQLSNIETDEEFETVQAEFDRLLEELEDEEG